jgi:hypothetical protein
MSTPTVKRTTPPAARNRRKLGSRWPVPDRRTQATAASKAVHSPPARHYWSATPNRWAMGWL